MSRAKQRSSQRGPRPRVGRPRGRGRKSVDQGSAANGSITPTPPPQEGESMEAEEAEPEHTVPTPAPRTSARQPTMPLQATLRRRKGAQDSCIGNKASKESPVHIETPNNPIVEVPGSQERLGDGGEGVGGAGNSELEDGGGGDGGNHDEDSNEGREEEEGEGEEEDEQEEDKQKGDEGPNNERPPKRRRTKLDIAQEGLVGPSASTDKSPPSSTKAGRAGSRGGAPMAKGKGGTEAVRGRGRPGRGKGSRQTRGPGSRGGKGAYRPRKPKGGPTNGENPVKMATAAAAAAVAAAPAKEPKAQWTTNDATKYDWTSELRKDVSIVRPTKNLTLAQLSVTVTEKPASLEQLKERQCALRDTAKTYSRTMVNLNRERASQALKDLKSDKDCFLKTPFYQQVQGRLEKKVEGRISVLERALDFKKGNASKVLKADQWAAREAFETNFVELCERTIQRFLREGLELSELWAVKDPYLNEHVLRRCKLDHIDQVTMTDLIESFITREGRDRSVLDQPQTVTRSNQGLYDRKVLETTAERHRRAFSAIVLRELKGVEIPPVSPPPVRPPEPTQWDVSMSNGESTAGDNSPSDAEVTPPNNEGNSNELTWASGLQFVLDSQINQNDPAQFSRSRRVTTREGWAMEALIQFRNGVTEFPQEDEPSADDVEYTSQQDLSDGGDEPEPGPPVKIPPRRSLFSLHAGGVCSELGPKTNVLQTKTLPPKSSMEASSAPHRSNAGSLSPLSAPASYSSFAPPGKDVCNPPPPVTINPAGEPQVAQNGFLVNSNTTCDVHNKTGNTLAPTDRHIKTPTPSKHSVSSTKRLRDGTRKENLDPSYSNDNPQNTVNNLPALPKPTLTEGPRPTAEGEITSGHVNPLRESSASDSGPFAGNVPPPNGDSSGGRPNGAGRKLHTPSVTSKADGRRFPHPPLSKPIRRQDVTANEEKRRDTVNTNYPKVGPSARHIRDKSGTRPPPSLTEYSQPGIKSPAAPKTYKGAHADSNAAVANSPTSPRGSRSINNSSQASWPNKRTHVDVFNNIPQDLFPPDAISAARIQQKAAENSARAAANSLSSSSYPHIVPKPPSKITPMNYPNYGSSNGGSSVNIPNFIPRSYPANRGAAVPQPYEYAAPNSSVARDARPPQPSQPSQPSHPPPWTDVGYTYPGPQPPSAQFQPPRDSNHDRAPAQPSDNRTHIINRPLPRQPAAPSPDYGNYINNGYLGPSNGSYTPQQGHQSYLPQYSGTPKQDPNHNRHPHESMPWPPPTTPAPVLSGDTSHAHSASRAVRSHDSLYSHSTFSIPAESKASSVNTPQPIRYYIGDGVYKTAPAPIDKPLMPHRPQDTVFEEDVYSRDLNLMARNGTWKGQQQHPPHMSTEDARRGGSGGN